MTYRRTTTLTVLHVVEEFRDDTDETPTLPGMRVYDTTGEDVTSVRPALAKCGPVASAGAERRRKAAK